MIIMPAPKRIQQTILSPIGVIALFKAPAKIKPTLPPPNFGLGPIVLRLAALISLNTGIALENVKYLAVPVSVVPCPIISTPFTTAPQLAQCEDKIKKQIIMIKMPQSCPPKWILMTFLFKIRYKPKSSK